MDRRSTVLSLRCVLAMLFVAIPLAGCTVQHGNDGMGGTEPNTPGVEWFDKGQEIPLQSEQPDAEYDSQ